MLLSGMIRQATITGRTDYINTWLGDRQGGRWAEQTVQSVVPTARPRSHSLQQLDDLHKRGVVTDEEYKKLRGRYG